jgi:dihydropteroate synthase
MQSNPTYGDVVRDVREYLYHMATVAESKGVRSENIWIDPGIGFGKTVRHNLLLLNHLEEFVRLNYPVLVGASRKSFIGKILGRDQEPLPASDRLEGSLAAQVLAQAKGAKILRVHDVKEARRAMELAKAILSA